MTAGIYSRKELAGSERQRTFKGDQLAEIAFPLGGLGAGCLHLGGSGNFQDFCLSNRPDFGHSPMTFAALHCRTGGREGILRVLEGPVQNPHIYNQGRFGNGALASGHEGLPHMAAADFTGEFPFARVRFEDGDLPVGIQLEGWSPFVPGDEEASGLPAAFLRYRLRNRSKRALQIQFSFHAQYPGKSPTLAGHRVRQRAEGETSGLFFDSDLPASHQHKASFAVVSPLKGQKADCAWFRGGWWDGLTILCNQLQAGKLQSNPQSPPASDNRRVRFGASLFWDLVLKPEETLEIPLVYCWHAPNSDLRLSRAEDADGATATDTGRSGMARTYRPWYATRCGDAWAVAKQATAEHDQLLARSRKFQRALFASSLPDYVLDAASANLAILKSPTVLRQEDGMLWCWEGSSYGGGCCSGTCTHVWNYAQALPYLFPGLERTLRDQELMWSMDRRGHVTFRAALPTGKTTHSAHAAADGQLGGIAKVYRDWRISGDDGWLKKRYPLVRRSLEYCIRTWDPTGKGALLEPHHNTYDIEFWGADPMCTSFYLVALRAMVEMARHLGREADVERYGDLAERGKAYCDQRLWNGQYYEQNVQVKGLKASRRLTAWLGGYSEEAMKLFRREGPKYQYGKGCISDGVIGEWYATMLGLPAAMTRTRVRRHLAAIFKHNFRATLHGHANPQRPGYALNDEPGLLLCSWPRGGKPSLPFVYSDEVWTGIEYQVASHMIYAGLLAEGLSIVRAVRLRYDGRRRNPWNEYECGNYYARALASYSLLLALSGVRYDAGSRCLEVSPRAGGAAAGQFFFATDGAWGTVHYKRQRSGAQIRVVVAEGELQIAEVAVAGDASPRRRRLRLDSAIPVRPRRARTFTVPAKGGPAHA